MTVGVQTGGLADVRDARRALLEVVAPGWARAVLQLAPLAFLVASMALIPVLVGVLGAVTFLAVFGAGLVFLASIIGVSAWQRRTRPVRPFVLRLWSRRVTIVQSGLLVLAVAAMLAVVGAAFLLNLPPWSFPVAILVVAAMLHGALYAVAWRIDPYGIDSQLLRDVPDHPTALDPVIGSRVSLMACAALASVGQVGGGVLARALRVSEQELGRLTAELVRGHYVVVHPEGRTWWFGLTPAGRSAYRRHLRALHLAGAQPGAVP